MTVSDDLDAATRHAEHLRTAVHVLADRLGDSIDVQRLKDDVARVAADLALVARANCLPVGTSPGEKIYIPDGDYDPSFWTDAEDEGLGASGRAR